MGYTPKRLCFSIPDFAAWCVADSLLMRPRHATLESRNLEMRVRANERDGAALFAIVGLAMSPSRQPPGDLLLSREFCFVFSKRCLLSLLSLATVPTSGLC
jgi:hypothetical protein